MLRPRWVYGACPKRRLHYRACPYRQQASAPVLAEERRIAKDGKAYRLGEFLHHYGQELGSVMWDYGLPHDPVAATEKFKAVVVAYEALAAWNEADAVSMFNGNSSWKGVCVQCGTASVIAQALQCECASPWQRTTCLQSLAPRTSALPK